METPLKISFQGSETSDALSALIGEGGMEHDRLRNEAEASGVFGVPTFVFEKELFWGGDRIGLLRERLDERGVPRR